MERINKILNHNLFIENLAANEKAEETRIFCHHDMTHFMDVARIAYIYALEESISVEKELIYAAALLHDIGKYIQYADGTPHELASAKLAEPILLDCGFDRKETDVILSAIKSHRDSAVKKERNLNGLLYRADKKSRSCFACPACSQCNWKDDKKNLEMTV